MGLHLSKTYDGRSVLSGEFRDADAETVLRAIHAYTDPPSESDVRSAGWCDAHHVIPWAREGPTGVWNLILLCDHHHELIHRAGWHIAFDGHALRVRRPDGAEIR